MTYAALAPIRYQICRLLQTLSCLAEKPKGLPFMSAVIALKSLLSYYMFTGYPTGSCAFASHKALQPESAHTFGRKPLAFPAHLSALLKRYV